MEVSLVMCNTCKQLHFVLPFKKKILKGERLPPYMQLFL
jgi:hypothetical protein